MSSVAAPADRRFRRSHVKPGRKTRRWITRALPLAAGVSLVVLVIAGGYRASSRLANARFLQISQITVRGNERLSQGEVQTALAGLIGESLVRTDLDQWRGRLLSSLWVRDAALRRAFPSTVEVVISERQPIGVGRLNGEMYLIDDGGVVIDKYGPQYADLDLPLIDGLAPSKGPDGTLADPERAGLAARVIASLVARPDVARRLSQIDVSDVHNAAVILANETAVIELGEDQFLPRLQGYLELAAGLRSRVKDIDHVDTRFENRLYVRPAMQVEKKVERAEPAVAGRASSTRR